MASKQIGKLKQRVGEIVSRGQSKTALADDFKELEADVQLRGAGLERLTAAADAYITSLTEKKGIETDSSGSKFLPCEALGTVMMSHGEEFGPDSVFGAALISFGRVHCRLGTLQVEHAKVLQNTYILKLHDGITAIKEYQALRKKFESRRVALDSYVSKVAKAKKDKDRSEAEEEVEIARGRFSEIAEEIHDRMLSIQKREAEQFAELTEFLETELAYAAAYHDTLLRLKEDWPTAALANSPNLIHRRSTISTQEPAFATTVRASIDSNHSTPVAAPRRRSNTASGAVPTTSSPRKRSDSLTTTDTGTSGATNGSGNANNTLRGSVTGWMGSLSRRRKGSISKKNFQSLDDGEDDWPTPSNSFRQRKPPAPPVRRSSTVFRPSNLMRVRALHDLTTVAPDELPFRVGDILTVLDEHVPHDANVWVRAEKEGIVGLIPMNYFEVAPSSPGKAASRTPSIRRLPTGFNISQEDETEQSDSPSSSLLQDVVVARQDARSRSGSAATHGGGKTTSLPEIQMFYYEGMEEPWNESASSLGPDPYDEDYDYPVMTRSSGLLPPSDPLTPQQELDRNGGEREGQTTPPSPSRHPVPAPSPRQLASTLAHVGAKKPPPPPPPARRSHSSAQVGTLVGSNAKQRGGGTATDPPTLPPPYRRPPIPARAATMHQGQSDGVSPFEP